MKNGLVLPSPPTTNHHSPEPIIICPNSPALILDECPCILNSGDFHVMSTLPQRRSVRPRIGTRQRHTAHTRGGRDRKKKRK